MDGARGPLVHSDERVYVLVYKLYASVLQSEYTIIYTLQALATEVQ
jgi:hypothetical protein